MAPRTAPKPKANVFFAHSSAGPVTIDSMLSAVVYDTLRAETYRRIPHFNIVTSIFDEIHPPTGTKADNPHVEVYLPPKSRHNGRELSRVVLGDVKKAEARAAKDAREEGKEEKEQSDYVFWDPREVILFNAFARLYDELRRITDGLELGEREPIPRPPLPMQLEMIEERKKRKVLLGYLETILAAAKQLGQEGVATMVEDYVRGKCSYIFAISDLLREEFSGLNLRTDDGLLITEKGDIIEGTGPGACRAKRQVDAMEEARKKYS